MPELEPGALAMFFALGVMAALAGSPVPALEAVRAAPAAALKAGDDLRAFDKLVFDASVGAHPGFSIGCEPRRAGRSSSDRQPANSIACIFN